MHPSQEIDQMETDLETKFNYLCTHLETILEIKVNNSLNYVIFSH